ncbi:MAG: DUF6850 family outer membrane beta-barrel protein [Bacteroidota bacterium]
MVTTNSLYLNLKKRALIPLSFILLSFWAHAQTPNTFYNLNAIERGFEIDLFHERYATLPSLINASNSLRFSYGKVNYVQGEGNFRHPQDYKKISGITLSTASLASLKDTNWTLYGALEYQNSKKQNVGINLSYGVNNDYSPYYFFQKQEGFWNHQSYNFSVASANKVSDKLSLGASLDYNTNQYYRKSDTRNETIALAMLGKVSASYDVKPNHKLSLTLGAERYKAESDLYNKFPKSGADTEYVVYLNTGLGSFLKSVKQGADIRRSIPEIRMQWYHKLDNGDLSIESATQYGQEKWIDPLISRVEENDVIAQFSYIRQVVNLFYNKRYAHKRLLTRLSANYLSGEGEVWEAPTNSFIQNYTNQLIAMNVKGDLLYQDRTINRIGLGLSLLNREQSDLNYGYKYNYTTVQPEFSLALNRSINPRLILFNEFITSYRYIANLNHDPFAADNIFVDWIGNPTADYLGTDAFNLQYTFGFTLNMPGNDLIEIALNISYWGVASTSNTFQDTVLNSDDYLSFDLGLSVFF